VIAAHSIDRLKEKVRRITKRNRGISLETVITELNAPHQFAFLDAYFLIPFCKVLIRIIAKSCVF
jgi:hypothetical protein